MRPLAPSLVFLVATTLAAAGEPLSDCRPGPGREPSACLLALSRQSPELTEAVTRELRSLVELYPDDGWPVYYLARVARSSESTALVQESARLFSTAGDITGEIRARADLIVFLGFSREFASAFEELEKLRDLASLSPLAEDRAIVDIAEAHYRMLSGGDLQEAYARLRDALNALQSAPPQYTSDHKESLRSLLHVTFELGMHWEANQWAEEALRFARQHGTPTDQVDATYNAIRLSLRSEPPSEPRKQELASALTETILLARDTDQAWTEASSRLLLCELVDGSERPEHLAECRRLARQLEDSDLERACLLSQAADSLESDPETARGLLDQAYSDGQDPWALLLNWPERLRVLWATRPRDQALEDSSTILAAIEALRRNQVGGASDQLLSASADAYYWISGKLLDEEEHSDRVARSFSIMERLRAQALREALETPPPTLEPPSPELARYLSDLERLSSEYTEVYRSLLDQRLESAERDRLLDRLAELERREGQILERGSAFFPARPSLEPPGPELAERVRAALAADEAVLSFQLGLWEGWDGSFLGGSWLTVFTSEAARVHRLEVDRADLDNRLEILLGLTDPEVPDALALLYDDLLDPALRDLPATVNKLIVVPDGAIHLLPFSLLRASSDGPPLVDDFSIQTVPSASLWLDWRDAAYALESEPNHALVLANPAVPAGSSTATVRAWEFDSGTALGPLPHAEREGRKVLRRLGGYGRLESGTEASEDLLKSEDLSRFSILHLASHAVVNPIKPGRSAVMLAAGSEAEDGFLRPSEIARLEGLDGKLVVLSACDTAAGSVLRGEGVLSLGRAFFEAGAHAVVASLWRLDDRLATRFFDDFYKQLRKGVTVSEALAQTQREWSRRGRPAAIWAGIVVLGNGDLVPIPGGIPSSPWRVVGMAAFGLTLLLTAVLLSRRRPKVV